MASMPINGAEQEALLGSWRTLLQTCLGLYHSLDAATRPPEVASAIVAARAEIARIKGILRDAGQDVADLADEVTVADANEVTHQLQLLSIYRRNLTLFLQQYAANPTSPQITSQLVDARRNIAEIKYRLREWGAPVDDLPTDSQ